MESHAIEVFDAGEWRVVAAGTTIGRRRLHRVPMVAARRLRVRIRTLGAPGPWTSTCIEGEAASASRPR